MTPQAPATILFTAFEPSGDFLGGAVIRELLSRRPDLRICAWGGPRMRAAGAEIIEETGHDAAMGLPGVGKIVEHIRMNGRIAEWVRRNQPALHVPVDSPAANFPVCKVTKAGGAKVVHLAAPQVWAWARHRVNKLRRLTDLVLCLLPFEEAWFTARAVPAKFIGHPLFDGDEATGRRGDEERERSGASSAPGSPRLGLFPGSRPAEWRNNFPIMLEAFARVRARWPNALGMVAASSERAEGALRTIAAARAGWPAGLTMAPEGADACIDWCETALTVSGTITLQIARRHRPMVVMYRIPAWKYWLIGRWIVRSEFATLPNLIAGREVVDEFVPCAGGAGAIIGALERLVGDPRARAAQTAGLQAVTDQFRGKSAATEAANAILTLLPR